MNTQKILNQAQKMAANAKDGSMAVDGKVYNFSFDSIAWVYNVSEDGEYLMRVNMKSLSKAKAFVKEWLTN